MPVHSEHKEYKENIDTWKQCRTIARGQKAVKEKGTEFLPKLKGQNLEMYESYKRRAYFFNATGRTVDGLVGVVFRKEPSMDFPESKKMFLENAGKEGSSLLPFARRTFRNVVTVGRHGVLLDAEDTESIDVNPYLAGYDAETIINWRVETVGDEAVLSMVVLKENTPEINPSDRFVEKFKERIRVLRLVTPALFSNGQMGIADNVEGEGFEPTEVPVYIVEIWVENPNSKREEDKYILEKVMKPKIRGKLIPYIPFVFFGPVEPSSLIQKSMIEDLCDVNISHYLTSADLEHGRHFTALPTAWVAGFKTDQDLVIGSQTAWVSEDANAQAGFLEYTGQGLQALEKALEQKESQMAILGARMLEVPKKAVEAADTHKQRQAGEASVLGSAASSVESGFTTLLKWAAEWLGIDSANVSVEFNKDYMPAELTAQMLAALTSALQSDAISWDTYVYNLQQGEILPDGRTAEEELELIEKRGGRLPIDEEEDDLDEEEEEEEEGELEV